MLCVLSSCLGLFANGHDCDILYLFIGSIYLVLGPLLEACGKQCSVVESQK